MLEHIPTDQRTLRQWLEAGYVEDGHLYPTRKGTPQGGVISPTLMNMTLDGLEQAVHQAVPRRHRVNVVRYADDLIVTGKSRRLLEETVRPALDAFLGERGLQLSDEKTAITHIKHGFAFLGQTFRKHAGTLHITPSNDSVMALVRKLGILIRSHVNAPMPALVKQLNQALRGWSNYHRHVVAGDAFSRVNLYVYRQLWRMLRRRHPGKSWKWLCRTYWDTTGPYRAFVVTAPTRKGPRAYRVLHLTSTNSQRYVKVRAHANPYRPEDAAYFARRRNDRGAAVRTLA